ncbi:unnamed protein product [Boreogadus saida]
MEARRVERKKPEEDEGEKVQRDKRKRGVGDCENNSGVRTPPGSWNPGDLAELRSEARRRDMQPLTSGDILHR